MHKLDAPTPEGHTVALIDCGMMASIDREDKDHIISAVIHLTNKDYALLGNDFIRLKILPDDCARAAIIPVTNKALFVQDEDEGNQNEVVRDEVV